MSTYDISQEAPGLLRAESSNITLSLTRTGPTTARISWNIPTPAAGCAANNQAYAGMVIAVDNTPANISKIPINTQLYTADPTVDQSLFAGDKIGSSLVVGAFYNDRTTSFVDISGLSANAPYYVTGYPVDTQIRYYIEGVHAYSMDNTGGHASSDTSGTQVIVLNPDKPTMGVHPTDPTGLSASTSYDFNIQLGLVPKPQARVDSIDCNPVPNIYPIVVDGSKAQTFQDLTNEINKQFALIGNPYQGPNPPNTGELFWNLTQQKLYRWNGYSYVQINNVLIQATDPTIVNSGQYWFDTVHSVLKLRNGNVWNIVQTIEFKTNPLHPQADVTYWFDGTQGYLWNGNTWCKSTTYVQVVDPSLPVPPISGSYWFDAANGMLYKWSDSLGMWLSVDSVQSDTDPNVLTNNSFWFDQSKTQLKKYDTSLLAWIVQVNVAISETEPSTPAAGKYWYKPAEMELYQRSTDNTSWIVLEVIAFPKDPSVRSFCDTWWNTSTNVINVWDAVGTQWVQAFLYNQLIDPALPLSLNVGDLWYDIVHHTLSAWNGLCFKPVDFISFATNPISTLPDGIVWHNTTDNTWNVKTGNVWIPIIPLLSAFDPTLLPAQTFWYNTAVNLLQMWNGIGWVSVSYTTQPRVPTKGDVWFNTATSQLLQWNGETWVTKKPYASVELDCHGNMLFTDNNTGSLSFVSIADGTLFKSLNVKFTYHDTKPGTDGVSAEPLYNEIGIGSDGSNDERRLLQNEIRYQLGYPAVAVELSAEQMDYVVDKAISQFRARSSAAYSRNFFFMSVTSETQRFFLTNKISGMNKIVDVLGVYRVTSAFLSSAHGAGVYGQIMLQQLYNMGSFDLLSYHIMAEYTKLLELLFAARITFTWSEQTRELFIHHRFPMHERAVCIEATVERTEQDLLSDRYSKPWLRRYAIATAQMILAETRGKFSSMPGAGGSVVLNASDLRQAANAEFQLLEDEIIDYVADRPELWGVGQTICYG